MRPRTLLAAPLALVLVAIGTGTPGAHAARRDAACDRARTHRPQAGKASYYGAKFHGRRTASGERHDRAAFTAAHRTLPFGTRVRVTNLRNRRSVIVRVNDRGPFGRGRVVDVSRAAARTLDMLRAGLVPVRVEVVELAARCGDSP